MMIWINAKMDYLKKKSVTQNIYDLYCFSCPNMLLFFFFPQCSWYVHHLACMCTCQWSLCCCICVTFHLRVHVCVRVSTARAKACPVRSKIFEAHSTHSVISFPVLKQSLKPLKSALHTVCQKQLTRCPWYLQQCLWLNLMHILQMWWMCCQT